MPASSATIGCNIAALRVKVIGLAPCSLDGRAAATRSGPRPAALPAACDFGLG